MTPDRIIDYQREALLRQQEHLEVALAKLRRHADELDVQREHNATLFALLLQRDRHLAAVRAQLQQIRDSLEVAA